MRRFLALLLLTVLISCASADVITDANLWIGSDGYTLVEERVLVEDGGRNMSQAIVPKDVNDLTAADELGKLSYTIIPQTTFDEVNFSFYPLEPGEEKVVWVKYGTPHLTRKNGVNWTISYSTPTTAHRTIIRVTFPVGANFISLKPEKLLRSYDKYAVWIFPQEDQTEFNCTYEYAGSGISVQPSNLTNGSSVSPPADNGIPNANTIVTVIVSIVFLSGVFYLAWRMELFKREIKEDKDGEAIKVSVEKEEAVKGPTIVGDAISYDIEGAQSKKKGRKVKDSILKMLEDSEMAVVKILEGSEEEELTQAYIHKTTGIPKSSLSDIIKRLEKRKILETTSQGRIKWLKLQKWVLE